MGKTTTALVFLVFSLAEPGWSESPSDGMRSRDRIMFMKMWRLVDQLEIDVDQAAVLFPLFSQHYRQMKEMRAGRKKAVGHLRDLLEEESPEDSKLLAAMQKVADFDKRLRATDDVFKKGLQKHLTVRQRAKLLLFSDHFRRDLRGFVEGMRATEGLRSSKWPEGTPASRKERTRD